MPQRSDGARTKEREISEGRARARSSDNSYFEPSAPPESSDEESDQDARGEKRKKKKKDKRNKEPKAETYGRRPT